MTFKRRKYKITQFFRKRNLMRNFIVIIMIILILFFRVQFRLAQKYEQLGI